MKKYQMASTIRRMSKTLPPSRTAPQFVVRFPSEDLRDRLKAEADKNNRSTNAEIVLRLEQSFIPWEQRPWEERMVVDLDRAMLKMLSADERRILLDRVKAAGGADAVNDYAPTVVESFDDLRPEIPDGPKISADSHEPSQDELGMALAMKVLDIFASEETKQKVRALGIDLPLSGVASDPTAMLRPLAGEYDPDKPKNRGPKPKGRFPKD